MAKVRHCDDYYGNYALRYNRVNAQGFNEEANQQEINYECRPIHNIETKVFANNIPFSLKHEKFVANICISQPHYLTEHQNKHVV
jgi:hypothetical protein